MKFLKSALAGKTIVNQLINGCDTADNNYIDAVKAGSKAMDSMRDFLCQPRNFCFKISKIASTCEVIGIDSIGDKHQKMRMR